jgi:hypothetical protein
MRSVIFQCFTFLFFLLFPLCKGISQSYSKFSFDSLHVSEKRVNLYLIPIGTKIDRVKSKEIGSIFKKAKLEINCIVLPEFRISEKSEWNNPFSDHKQFTTQMKRARTSYFEGFQKDPSSIYFFVIPGFISDSIEGYSVLGKSVAFLTQDGIYNSSNTNRILGSCLGLKFESDSLNIMSPFNSGNKNLHWNQCVQLRENPISFSFYDDYENVSTNNGLVATFLWKTNSKGEIEFDIKNPFLSIKKGELRNTYLVYRKVTNPFFKELFVINQKPICAIHIIALLLSFMFTFPLRRKLNLILDTSGFFKRMSLRLLKLLIWISSIGIVIISFYVVDIYYENSFLHSIHLPDFKGAPIAEMEKNLTNKKLFIEKKVEKPFSQVFICAGKNWKVTKQNRVLYFKVVKGNNKFKGRFIGSKNRLLLHENTSSKLKLKEKANCPYIVFRFYNQNNQFQYEKLYNFQGHDLTKKINLEDPAKRILLFVNGYRPVSVSNSLEENLRDIQKSGIEYEDSRNVIYNFDRYKYWTPWNQINSLFVKRINPSEIWYADGHHSVSTSNYNSLVNFSAVSSVYPLPCRNLKKHHCYRTKITGNKVVDTYSLLASKSNISGFKKRRNSGEIAGYNLEMLLNELPNKSKNDTLFIVCHSMGYAYSLGILKELRGKINFGGFYILAPENASAGKTISKEWKEVWQYGSDFDTKNRVAPCLQDGVAVQTAAKGLTSKKRVYIPFDKQNQMGFFKSHFVGYYTWIFDIKKGKKGAVSQH